MSHAAVLLAGGKSSRMGCEKSALLICGEPLWRHQLAVLRATEPAELFISGKRDGPYADCGVEILADKFPDCGPLGGIATALRRCKSDRLLVLAVDMPAMTAEFLRSLIEQSYRTAMGVVPSLAADGRRWSRISPSACDEAQPHVEPLAAVYPRAALALAEECLRDGARRLEDFVRRAETLGLLRLRDVAGKDQSLFENWNVPADVPSPHAVLRKKPDG